ncbi:hypothetical protein HYDPIDRAFT_108347 [Hydnomerulius pinastri MD-312]|nr:hypothetical protein HYDPIDRAFT_108347 [Hydnomerulius pinastri MD-312]
MSQQTEDSPEHRTEEPPQQAYNYSSLVSSPSSLRRQNHLSNLGQGVSSDDLTQNPATLAVITDFQGHEQLQPPVTTLPLVNMSGNTMDTTMYSADAFIPQNSVGGQLPAMPPQYYSSHAPPYYNPPFTNNADVPPWYFVGQPLTASGWALDFGGGSHHAPPMPQQLALVPPPSPFPRPCRWLGGPSCHGLAVGPVRNREMSEHLRFHHQLVGHERDVVRCQWAGCHRRLQRMNMGRHIVTTHLHEAAHCRFCGGRFSRPDVVARHERTCDGSPSGRRSANRDASY